ncbi:MAG: hypothetical protein M1838_000147 [Thelocarpon superellum]|nr:MAG: hypothetical protein M1838_000147 [Thelocarpon superellum]
MEPSSSSKVTVQYFDPSNLFPLLSPGLLSRLPLRNLHWKSPSRPLRSITQLHVDLVPFGHTIDQARSVAASSDELVRARSSDSNSGSPAPHLARAFRRNESYREPVKERRHQIPGLRRTPYLKVYLLRCDDGDVYKASSRKLLREWIKEHTLPNQGAGGQNTHEDHDAFEWLIVHVVLPNTPAAAQARSSGSSAANAGAGERPASTSRWTGRGTSSVLEKIKSDFNGSSKTATDRVAQIRLHKTDIPPHLFQESFAAGSGTYEDSPEGQQEQEAAWSDLVAKFKSLILTSFDLRVGQYEEDIREKDAQRALPGWNFCTFFVLKEGLARGFESVGLVEDALVGYDELADGLDGVVREQAIQDERQGQAFLPYTEDLQIQALQAKKAAEQAARDAASSSADIPQGADGVAGPDEWDDEGPASLPLSAGKKPYRDLILSNNISVFDFRCYLFTRQMSLLLRLGNAWSSREELLTKIRTHFAPDPGPRHAHERSRSVPRPGATSADEMENLEVLAEVCARGTDFVTSVARVMRTELHRACATWDPQGAAPGEALKRTSSHSIEEHGHITQIIDNMVACWTFSVTQQLLAETATKALPIPPSSLSDTSPSSAKVIVNQQEPKSAIPEPKTMMHPARISSLHLGPNPLGQNVPPGQPSPNIFPSGAPSAGDGPHPSDRLASSQPNTFLKSGIEELAANRAELYHLSRSVVAQLGFRRGWLQPSVNLAGDHDPPEPAQGDRHDVLYGLSHPVLRVAMRKKGDFYSLYEILTDKVLRHYTVANRMKSMESIMCELATLKFNLGDYATAATYFNRLLPSFVEANWARVETTMLRAYAQCLKRLDRDGDYVRVLVELLAQAVNGLRDQAPRSRSSVDVDERMDRTLQTTRAEAHGLAADRYLAEMLKYSQTLPQRVTVALQRLCNSIRVMTVPQHYDDRDGFRLQLRLRYQLSRELQVERVKIRVVSTANVLSREIWLESEEPVTMMPGDMGIWVGTHVVIPGAYSVDKIVLEVGNLDLVHELSGAKAFRIVYHPRPSALDATAALSHHLNLDTPRSIEITISSGWNHVRKGELRLRSASAGLRLRTADAEVIDGDVVLSNREWPGVIEFTNLAADRTATITVPYGVERDVLDIAVKIEIAYTTDQGDFLYGTNATVAITLPLGVNVQEVFKRKALFSRFTISTATSIPLRVWDSRLDGPNSCRIEAGGSQTQHALVFPQQPVSLLYKIERTRRSSSSHVTEKGERSLALRIDYSCLDDEIRHGMERAFSDALGDSPYEPLRRLLTPVLLARGTGELTPEDMEAIGLCGEIHVRPYNDIGWADVISPLSSSERGGLEAWLRTWHERHSILPLPSAPALGSRRTIIIPVELPQVSVVHTVDIELKPVRGEQSYVAVGQTLAARLRMTHSRDWGEGRARSREDAGALEFVYEIHASPDQWLVGGQKKAHFTAKEEDEQVFPLLLVPLRPGHLLLPTVEVHPFTRDHRRNSNKDPSQPPRASHRSPSSLMGSSPGLDGSMPDPLAHPSRGGSSPGKMQLAPSIACETDCRTLGQSILVIANLTSTTVNLDQKDLSSGVRGGTPERSSMIPS